MPTAWKTQKTIKERVLHLVVVFCLILPQSSTFARDLASARNEFIKENSIYLAIEGKNGTATGKDVIPLKSSAAQTGVDFLRDLQALKRPVSKFKKNSLPGITSMASTAQASSAATSDPRVSNTYFVDPQVFTTNQKYGANTLSAEWENAPGKISTNTNWTSKPTNYFVAEDSKKFTLKSIAASRDMEVDTWTAVGYTYLRLTDDGKAIYFEHNANRGNGYLSIGLATGVNEATEAPQGRYELYKNLDLLGTVEGYRKKPTDDDYFTFGVDGFDIYVKFNGKEIVRFQDYRHMAEGKIALKHSAGIGLRKTGARHYKDQVLFSDIKNNVLDLRDFGLRDIKTSGSIQGGSNQLRLGAPTKFKKGDYVIVELGGEAGTGKRGTVGVGGTWPAKKYSSAAERDQDTSQSVNTYAWVESDGTVYQWTGSVWKAESSNKNRYFTSLAVPLALKAQILDISEDGLTLTLDRTATVDAMEASVHLDNSFFINKLGRRPATNLNAITPTGITLKIPAGDYAIGEMMFIEGHPGWKLIGAGKDKTRLFSPKGAPSASLHINGSPNVEVRDFHLEGNAREEGFGVSTDKLYFQPEGKGFLTETNINPGGFPWGIRFQQGSHNGVAENLKVTDVFTNAVGAWFSDNVWAKDIEATVNELPAALEPWFFQWAAAKGGGCNGCSFKSTRLVGAFSSFKSAGTQFLNSSSTNGLIAVNSGGNFLIKDMTVEIVPTPKLFSDSIHTKWNPLIDINDNISQQAKASYYESQGGIIENVTMIQRGYVNAENDVLMGITVGPNNPNIKLLNSTYIAPGFIPPSGFRGPLGILSLAQNSAVDGFRVLGAPASIGNINISDGIVKNSVGDLISARGNSATVIFENNRPNSNKAPVIDFIENKTMEEGQELKFTVGVSDPNNSATDTLGLNQKHTFALEARAPEGMTINETTGEITWTSKEEQGPGNYTVTVKVTDSGVPPLMIDGKEVWPGQPSLSATRSFTITVNESNTAPSIQLIPEQTVEEGKELRIPVIATDTDKPAQPLTYSLEAGAPNWAVINPVTGLLTLTPGFDQARDAAYVIGVNVTDRKETAKLNFKVKVNDAKPPLTLEPITDQTANENQVLKVQVKVRGEVVGLLASPSTSRTFIYALEPAGAPEGASIDPALGEFTWTPNEKQGPGTYPVTVKVTDQNDPSLSAVTSFNVTVQEVNEPPVISEIPVQTVKEGERLTFKINVSDADLPKQAITLSVHNGAEPPLSLQGLASDRDAKIDATGQFGWTPDAGQAGKHVFTAIAKDSMGGETRKTFEVNVEKKEVIPPPAPQDAKYFGKLLPDHSFLLEITGSKNQNYVIETSTDLFTWTSIATVTTDTNGRADFTDSSAKDSSFRFYRVVLPV